MFLGDIKAGKKLQKISISLSSCSDYLSFVGAVEHRGLWESSDLKILTRTLSPPQTVTPSSALIIELMTVLIMTKLL